MRLFLSIILLLNGALCFSQKDEVNKGNSFVWQKKYGEAIEFFTKAIDIETEKGAPTIYSYKSYMQRGDCYCKLKDSVSAFNDLNSAIKLDSTKFDAYGVKARCFLSMAQDSLALLEYDRVIDIFKSNGVKQSTLYMQMGYYNERADLEMQMEKYKSAVADYDKVISIFNMSSDEMAPSMGYNPALANAYYQRGFAKLYTNDRDGACKDWKSLLKRIPKGVKAATRTKEAMKENCN